MTTSHRDRFFKEVFSAIEYLPVVIPLIIYHGPALWNWQQSLNSLFKINPELAPDLPDYRDLLDDLLTIKDEDIRGAAKPRMTLFVQKHFSDDNLSARLAELAVISGELTPERDRDEYIKVVVQHLVHTEKLTPKDIYNFIDQTITGRGGEIMPTPAQIWMEEGFQKGILRGG
ncbi:MAG: Rpn family recombination-promoting nuclease/putative transposase [Deltaproteobacteria bacterium]|nr:Rpn family recombination-promoting nuclease/putative transposase [Deltaproteobacteria bacterium]